jgi:hypothetical protein
MTARAALERTRRSFLLFGCLETSMPVDCRSRIVGLPREEKEQLQGSIRGKTS